MLNIAKKCQFFEVQEMTRLTATDALFVYADSAKAPMNMGSVQILKLPAGYKGDFFTDFKQFVADRIDYLPKLKMRLASPYIGLPHWVEAEDFHIDEHVHRTRVRSEDPAELYRKLGRIQHVSFDRSKPLFMFYVIEGLADGRIAVVQKFHHAFADATTAIKMMSLFCDEGFKKQKRGKARGAEASDWLLKRWLTGSVEDLRRTVSSIPGFLGAARSLFGEGTKEMFYRVQARPKSIFNERLSNDRLFAFRNWPMKELNEVRVAAGLTFNDIGLALYGGALRRYLDELDALPEDSLVCNVPIGVDRKGGDSGNAVLAVWVPLGTDLEDRSKRVDLIKTETGACKAYVSGLLEGASAGDGIQLPSFLVRPLAFQMGSELLAWLKAPAGNVAMSNVPGPPKKFHIAGAEVEALYGLPMVLHGQAVSMTFTSYAGRVVLGILCCEKALPEPDRIIDYMEEELQALKQLYLGPAARKKAQAPRRLRKKTPRRAKKVLKKVSAKA